MRTKGIIATVIAIVFAVAFAGCGGGGGTVPSAVQGTSKGVITGQGNVIVNGVKFNVSGANVIINDNPNRPENELKDGMIVTVKGMIDDANKIGIAARVEFADNLEGPVSSIDLTANTLTVLGQTVLVTPTTVFEDTTDLTTLAVNNIVEVSGFADATGAIQATRIELKLAAPVAATPIEVKGNAANLDTTAKTFTIGAMEQSSTQTSDLVESAQTTIPRGAPFRNSAPCGFA